MIKFGVLFSFEKNRFTCRRFSLLIEGVSRFLEDPHFVYVERY